MRGPVEQGTQRQSAGRVPLLIAGLAMVNGGSVSHWLMGGSVPHRARRVKPNETLGYASERGGHGVVAGPSAPFRDDDD
jgi:hypothetical protein